MDIVVQSECQYHVLLIIADGQVTRSVDTGYEQFSPQEGSTIDAIVAASELPLSIVLVGVGDGPWDTMKEFDDNIPARAFDNFQFVNFTEIMSRHSRPEEKEAAFALAALMEIPVQFKACVQLHLLNCNTERVPSLVPLPPPASNKFNAGSSRYRVESSFPPAYVPSSMSTQSTDTQLCPVCWVNPKNMAFGCGHQTCENCGDALTTCPICRMEISMRIRLY
ncbi:hypothetical protein KP509_22G062200 [Ceratopteris richardii]|nr:hypothetical protein KP509_22G062200 [Ceratopteris richardii]